MERFRLRVDLTKTFPLHPDESPLLEPQEVGLLRIEYTGKSQTFADDFWGTSATPPKYVFLPESRGGK